MHFYKLINTHVLTFSAVSSKIVTSFKFRTSKLSMILIYSCSIGQITKFEEKKFRWIGNVQKTLLRSCGVKIKNGMDEPKKCAILFYITEVLFKSMFVDFRYDSFRIVQRFPQIALFCSTLLLDLNLLKY